MAKDIYQKLTHHELVNDLRYEIKRSNDVAPMANISAVNKLLDETYDRLSSYTSNLMLAILTGLIFGCAVAAIGIMTQHNLDKSKMVDCVEYIEVDNFSRCAIFKWKDMKYATQYAETYPDKGVE